MLNPSVAQMKESALRDHIADNLDIIEPGLRLLAREYPLPCPDGASGRVDLLARDSFGNFVVIELKKSDQTARTALHELMKYLALLQREKGIAPARIRCVVVSTDWRELRIPFSELVETSPFSLEGRLLHLDEARSPVSSTKVKPVPRVEGLVLPASFPWLTFEDTVTRDSVLASLAQVLPRIGIRNALMVALDAADPESLRYPLSMVLVLFPFAEAEAEEILSQNAFPVERLEEDMGAPAPQAARNALESRIFCIDGVQDVHYSTCETFAAERANWTLSSLVRVGPTLSDDTLFPDEDVIDMLIGANGVNDSFFMQSVSASHKMQFEHFVQNLKKYLSRYPGWWEAAAPLIAEARTRDAVLTVQALCPTNLLFRLALYWRYRDRGWLPLFELTMVDAEQGQSLHGGMAWDGVTVPMDPAGIVPDSIWLLAPQVSQSEAVIRGCGLCFPVFHFRDGAAPVRSIKAVPLDLLEHQIAAEFDAVIQRLGPVSAMLPEYLDE